MNNKIQLEIYQKYMTITSMLEEILKTYEKEISCEKALETGHRYFKGIDVDKDYEKAVQYYRQAADEGIADAYFALSLCYKSGKGVEADLEQERILVEKGIKVLRRNLCGIMGLEDELADFEIGRKLKTAKIAAIQEQESANAETNGEQEKTKIEITEFAEENIENVENTEELDLEKAESYLAADYQKILFEGTEKLCDKIDITKIVFSDSLDESIKVCDYRDISQEKDSSVIGWVEKQGEEKSVLHIDGKGTICAPENSQSLFAEFEKVEEIVFGEVFNTSNVTDMGRMFSVCRNLNHLDVGGFNTANVTDMCLMFYNCKNLNQLDVRGFDTVNVVDMSGMFYYCKNLGKLDVSEFNTSNVIGMEGMFSCCSSLRNIDVSGFDTANVINMESMFSCCSSLRNVDVSGFITKNVKNMKNMFRSCENLSELDVSGFDISNVTNMSDMFSGCDSLAEKYKHLDRTLNCSYKTILFEGSEKICDIKEITKIVFSDSLAQKTSACDYRDISEERDESIIGWLENPAETDCILHISGKALVKIRVSNGHALFEGFSSVKEIVFENSFSTESMTTMSSMFSECSSLEQVDVSGFVTGNVTDMSYMFNGCSSLKELDLNGFDTSNVTNMKSMFKGCGRLKRLDLTGFATKNVNSMSSMFGMCSSLKELNLSGFDTSNVTDMSHMFEGCSSLEKLDVSGFSVEKLVEKENMFTNCVSLPRKCKRLGGSWIKNWF